MKRLFITTIYLYVFCVAYAQPIMDCPDCPCIIELGDKYTKKREYANAIDLYNAATACDINLKDETDKKIKTVFRQIEKERDNAIAAERISVKAEEKVKQSLMAEEKAKKEAIEAQKRTQNAFEEVKIQRDSANLARIFAEKQRILAEKALADVEKQKKLVELEKYKTEEALIEAETQRDSARIARANVQEQAHIAQSTAANLKNVLDALYFYQDSLALAFDGKKYGFINKSGKSRYGYIYDDASPYSKLGYARVKKGKTEYLVDVRGFEHEFTNRYINLRSSIHAFSFERNISRKNMEEIWKNYQLKVLILKGCNIQQLTSKIGQLKSLEALDLSQNELSVLPPNIGELFALRALDLSENEFSLLPDEIWQLESLRTLNFRGNELSSLPDDIGDLKLQSLDLRGTKLRKEEVQKVKNLLPNCSIISDFVDVR